ncbi:flavin monoamine oxidase family protein [Pseudohongiella spirulinae]|uniref:Amine oxidase n=1 Tax=Pseudohongiella spirulinae TaxID=1249552 RepID=A0A0S2KAN6_9GAMM|nr:FAD-dependent oxidoreductase [Pseudohongiella spirulinae]ALO45134.1 amine oxidase [Pseudohongiella spirulinae]
MVDRYVCEADVAIIGGGLSGLYAAWLLEQAGITNYVLLEARQRIGGRILSVTASVDKDQQSGISLDRFDLGPSWFWPDMQAELGSLIESLGLEVFQQHESGDLIGERSPSEAPVRMRGYVNSPPSMRLSSGTQQLTEALQKRLGAERIFTGQIVNRLSCHGSHVEVGSVDEAGNVSQWRTPTVLLALPPRLAVSKIECIPPLPESLRHHWQATPTWMAPHAKYIAVYDAPFWRKQGLSGEARSLCGPMNEIHDASMPGGSAALFGFLGVPSHMRRGLSEQRLKELCREQLGRLFGARALEPRAELIKDWAQEMFTATEADENAAGHHVKAPPNRAADGPWRRCLVGIGSEWSVAYPGYLAGAVDAAAVGVEGVLRR